MNIIFNITQKWHRHFSPSIYSMATRFLYECSNVSLGAGLRADGIPRCIVDPGSRVSIGKEVELRKGVEIRCHGNSSIEIGDGCRIDRGVRILASNNAKIRIGSGTRIGLYSVFNGGDSINIGRDVLISGFVYLQTSQHRFSDRNRAIRDQGYYHAPLSIDDGAWVAAHVVVMPGVKIGSGAVIGSNAVVTKSVDSFAVVGGVPAKPIGVSDLSHA